ncbi:MAG: hypothetical protein ACREDR_47830, partial [Blastocatellia bacterium]
RCPRWLHPRVRTRRLIDKAVHLQDRPSTAHPYKSGPAMLSLPSVSFWTETTAPNVRRVLQFDVCDPDAWVVGPFRDLLAF